jgi:GNAT superfamily N-acetyltransferase
MFWRIPHGGKMWRDAVGESNRKAFRKLIKDGQAHGILAFEGDRPIGWCSFGRRADFPRTETMKAYQREDAAEVWSINCFFVLKEYRNSGVGELMCQAAVKAVEKRKGKVAEAYPVPLTKDGKKLPAAFVYTGPEAIFKKVGFKEVQRLSYSRPLYRLSLVGRSKKAT